MQQLKCQGILLALEESSPRWPPYSRQRDTTFRGGINYAKQGLDKHCNPDPGNSNAPGSPFIL